MPLLTLVWYTLLINATAAAAATKSLQSCPALCDHIDGEAHHAPLSLGFSRQEHWSGFPFPSPMHEREKWKWSSSVVSESQRPHGLQPTRLLHPWDFPGKSTGVGCHYLLHPRSVGAQYATGDQWRITPERMKGWSQSKNNTHLGMWLVIEARSYAVRAILHRNLECQVHESRQIGSGQIGDDKSERLHSRNQQTKMDWNGWI